MDIQLGFLDIEFALLLKIFTVNDRIQMNPKKFLNNTTISVQLPYIAGHSLKKIVNIDFFPLFHTLRNTCIVKLIARKLNKYFNEK